jgi:hypothetical protein
MQTNMEVFMKQVDELIRGEMSAVKSIDAILGKIKNENEKTQLNTIRQDHVMAIDTLKRFAPANFKESTESSGPWGAFASAFTGGASFFGDKAALKALQVGEQHGLNEYREAIEDDSINSELKQAIQSRLMPNQEKHLRTIDSYMH